MREQYLKEDSRFENWLNKTEKEGIAELNKIFSKFVIEFCKEMSLGLNISKQSKKGGRSKKRINALRQKVVFVLSRLQERNIKTMKKINRESLHKLFEDMRTGVLKNRFGKPYLSTGDYVKDFKAFYHWYMKKYNIKEDITEELDRRGEKPKFVYFTEEEFNKMIKTASRDLQIVMAIMWDSGCRVKELMHIQVQDFSQDFKDLTIKEETSKTFGRKIKIMFCGEQVKNYIKEIGLKKDDYIIIKNPEMCNKELKEIGLKVLGENKVSEKNLTLYDFRHSSACFWVVRYKSESALKYRFGWKKSDMIHYYTEFLGMKDTITEDDLYSDITKTELEKEIVNLKSKVKDLADLSQLLLQAQINNKGKLSREDYIKLVKVANGLSKKKGYKIIENL